MPPTNDDWSAATVLAAAGGGPLLFSNVDATWQGADEPAYDDGATVVYGGNDTVWFKVTPTASGAYFATLGDTDVVAGGDPTAGYDTVMSVWTGDPTAGWVFVDFDDDNGEPFPLTSECQWLATAGTTYLIRVAPLTTGDTRVDIAIRWGPVPDSAATMKLDVVEDAKIDSTPDELLVMIGNGVADEDVNFTIDADSTIVATIALDDEGNLLRFSVPIPLLSVGFHTLTATTAVTGLTDTLTFDVLDVDSDDTTDPVDEGPPPALIVPRWHFYDPTPPTERTDFTVNPDEADSPLPEIVLTTEATTAPDGQVLTWQGSTLPAQWTVSGELLNQTDVTEFWRWSEKWWRIYLVDHLNRGWVVLIENFDVRPVRDIDRPWHHHYSFTLHVLHGPVTLA